MLYRQSNPNNNFSFFVTLLNLVANGDTRYKGVVDDILIESADFICGRKNIYNIDRSNFEIIITLNEVAHDLIREKESFDQKDYISIYDKCNRSEMLELV
jgi:hypothetical protein